MDSSPAKKNIKNMVLNRITFHQLLIGQLQLTFGIIGLISLLWYIASSTPASIKSERTTPIELLGQQQGPVNNHVIQPLKNKRFRDHSFIVMEGDTLESIFRRKQISINELYEIIEADEPYLVLDVLQPGDQLTFRIEREKNRLETLSRIIDPSKAVTYQRNGHNFVYQETLTSTNKVAEVTRGTIAGNFYVSASSSGLTDNSVMTITQLLKSSLNFRRDLRAGDHFQVIMERETIEGNAIGKDRLLAARVLSRGKEFGAYLHSDGSYYNAVGESLVPALLRYPTRKKYRVSSHFNPRRVHPVTGRVKPHNGVDFAMPTGTPILSTGHGRVTRVASHRYAGKYIDIDEFGPYSTRFLHLSKILVEQGQQVERGQVIALSGNTGRSTGPHLHYELHIKGRPVNPMTAGIPMLKSIPGSEIKDFHLQVTDMRNLMLSGENVVHLDQPPTENNRQENHQYDSAKRALKSTMTSSPSS